MQPQNPQPQIPEADQSTRPVFQQPSRTAKERKGGRRALIMAIVLLSVALLTAAGLSAFYFLYRTSDIMYDSMLKNLYIMRDSAGIIPDAKQEFQVVGKTKPKATDRKEAAERYIAALSNIKKSPVLEKDNVVRREYDSDKATIEAYGQSSLDLLNTLDIYTEVDSTCRNELSSIEESIETLAMLNEHIAGCSRLLDKYPNVPLESFDNAHYRKLVQVYSSVIDGYRMIMVAYERQDERALERAAEDLGRSYAAYQLATSGSPEMKNTANPTQQINRVIESLERRKSVFFRH